MESNPRYVYLGDLATAPELRGMACDPVRRPDGKCVVCLRMATALVRRPARWAACRQARRLRVVR